jgi:hypothetical protein
LGNAGTRLVDKNGQEVVDLLRAVGLVRRHALTHANPVKQGRAKINVGSLPLMLALKWVAANSGSRLSTKRAQDNVDLRQLVQVNLGRLPVRDAANLIVNANAVMAAKFMQDMEAMRNELEDELE